MPDPYELHRNSSVMQTALEALRRVRWQKPSDAPASTPALCAECDEPRNAEGNCTPGCKLADAIETVAKRAKALNAQVRQEAFNG